MDYETAIITRVTNLEARQEIKNHGLLFSDFVLDCGNKENYTGKQVLCWLGY